jgi:hypothetical protein
VDVTWTTEESGLLLGISVKTINFRDGRSKNFQKNLTNRRGDMVGEALTLHRRFPYGVVAGFLFLDKDAKSDQTEQRKSTFEMPFLAFESLLDARTRQGETNNSSGSTCYLSMRTSSRRASSATR